MNIVPQRAWQKGNLPVCDDSSCLAELRLSNRAVYFSQAINVQSKPPDVSADPSQ